MMPPLNAPGHIGLVSIPVPVATVITYVGNISSASPTPDYTLYPEANGWMLCDGRSLVASKYPELFSALGYLYGGSGDNFNLPDLRGMFMRGVSDKSPATENRQAAEGGTATGVGSKQDFALQTHVHTYTAPNQPITAGESKAPAVASINTQSETGPPEQSVSQSPGNVKLSPNETRPDNIFVYYLIKYTSHLPGLMLP